MKTVEVSMSIAKDGFYSAYCTDHPSLFGSGNTPSEALEELNETLRIVREDGKDMVPAYPDWLDGDYEFRTTWNVRDLMTYYAGIITPSALGRLSGINPKQVWSYMHGKSKPRKAQVDKIGAALNRLGQELIRVSIRQDPIRSQG